MRQLLPSLDCLVATLRLKREAPRNTWDCVTDVTLALNCMEIRDTETFRSLTGQRPWEILLRDENTIRSIVGG